MFSTEDQYGHHFVARKNYATVEILVCEQALQGALAAGQEKEGELATTSLEFESLLQFACGYPSSVRVTFPPIIAKRKRARM